MTRKRLLAYTAAAVCVSALVAGAFVAGSRWSQGGPLGEFTRARWDADLAEQREQLARIEQDVDGQVAALATRVGRMQAQLIRLDALGKQLTDVAKLKRAGHQVHVWTVNEPQDVELCARLGVDAIITNRPKQVLSQLGRD